MPELLQRATSMKVFQASDYLKVEPNWYVDEIGTRIKTDKKNLRKSAFGDQRKSASN